MACGINSSDVFFRALEDWGLKQEHGNGLLFNKLRYLFRTTENFLDTFTAFGDNNVVSKWLSWLMNHAILLCGLETLETDCMGF